MRVGSFMSLTPRPNEDEPAHWQGCADEARRMARQSVDPLTRKTLAQIADAYEQLAALARARIASKT